MRPVKPASSSGRAPWSAIAAMLARMDSTDAPMPNSTRTRSAPSAPAATAERPWSAEATSPGLNRSVVNAVGLERRMRPPRAAGSAATRYS
jgi:hypothetical protein